MADDQPKIDGEADGNDYNQHNEDYKFFVNIAKFGTIFVTIIVILMAIFLV